MKMHNKTKILVRELIEYYEANGRDTTATIKHFVDNDKCSEYLAHKWLKKYKQEGIGILEDKNIRLLDPRSVEMCKKVLELLKEDPNISKTEGAAILNTNTTTFGLHRKRLTTPGMLTPEMLIQLGLVEGALPSRDDNKKDKPSSSRSRGADAREGMNNERGDNDDYSWPAYEDLPCDGGDDNDDDWSAGAVKDSKPNLKRKKPSISRHCLLCYSPLEDHQRAQGNGKPTPSLSSSSYSSSVSVLPVDNDCSNGELDEIGENLNAIHALQNIFGLTSSDLIVDEMKASIGKWYDLCKLCDAILRDAMRVHLKILKLSRKLEKCKEKIRDKIKVRLSSEEEEDLIVTKIFKESFSPRKRKIESSPKSRSSFEVKLELESDDNEASTPNHFEDDSFELNPSPRSPDKHLELEPTPITNNSYNNDSNSITNQHPCPAQVDITDLIKLPDKPRQAVCETCGEEMRPSQIPMHAFRVHDILMEGFKAYKCHHEGCTYATLSTHCIQRHLDTHLPYDKRKHVCSTCGKKFSRKSLLRKHEYTHTGIRPFQCEECGSAFAASSTLFNHRKIVHEKDGRYMHRKKPKVTESSAGECIVNQPTANYNFSGS